MSPLMSNKHMLFSGLHRRSFWRVWCRSEVCTVETNIEYQCMICMDEFVVGSKIQRLPCSHCFHEDCIFFAGFDLDKTTCPICRYGHEQYSLSGVE